MLGIYSYFEAPEHIRTFTEMIDNPGRHPDRSLVKQSVKMMNVFQNGFYFMEQGDLYRAVYEGEKAMPAFKEGGYISVEGRVRDKALFFSNYHVHRYRLLKIVLSIVALGITIIYLGVAAVMNVTGSVKRGVADDA